MVKHETNYKAIGFFKKHAPICLDTQLFRMFTALPGVSQKN